MRSAPAAGLLPLLLGLRLLLGGGAEAQYSSDLCNWKGSGLTHESHKKDVEQVYLRCSEGSIEWMYPTGALIVNLRPNTSPASYKHLTVCIKPFKDSAGANIYLEKTGELKLLVRDGERSPSKVYCFGYDQGGLFVEATPQQDISRKITGFQYELMSRGIASDLHTVSGLCERLKLPDRICNAQVQSYSPELKGSAAAPMLTADEEQCLNPREKLFLGEGFSAIGDTGHRTAPNAKRMGKPCGKK
uniref:Meteorin-like protein n=1 Tax=Pavo cristatus TaxID=9049 RepID=A0A8C9F4H3_PAVCR